MTRRRKHVPLRVVDRPVGFDHERNDCVVRALSNAIDMPYPEAHALLAAAGRKERAGTWLGIFAPIYAKYGLHTHFGYLQRPTLGSWLAAHPRGSYIVHVNLHVFAVRDGLVLDHGYNSSELRVIEHWSIGKEVPRPLRVVDDSRVKRGVLRAFVDVALQHKTFSMTSLLLATDKLDTPEHLRRHFHYCMKNGIFGPVDK